MGRIYPSEIWKFGMKRKIVWGKVKHSCYFSAKTSLKFVSTKNKVFVSLCPVFHKAPFSPTKARDLKCCMVIIFDLSNKNSLRKFRNFRYVALEALMPNGCTRRYTVKIDLV
jgi:hypothetical protein